MGCGGKGEEVPAEADHLLAEVYNRQLYSSEIEGMVPAESSPEDSALLTNAIVERWVRESLLMNEAEKNVSKNLNIDQLVKDYRASLIRYNYEKSLIELELDSVVSEEEKKAYYDKHKDQYRLDYSIMRGYFIKIPLETEGLNDLKNWMRNTDNPETLQQIKDFCEANASVYFLDEQVWYKKTEIINYCPKGKLSVGNLRDNTAHNIQDDKYLYLVKVVEAVADEEIAPMSYIEENVLKVILHDRKIQLLDNEKEKLYERETRKNNVKIYK